MCRGSEAGSYLRLIDVCRVGTRKTKKAIRLVKRGVTERLITSTEASGWRRSHARSSCASREARAAACPHTKMHRFRDTTRQHATLQGHDTPTRNDSGSRHANTQRFRDQAGGGATRAARAPPVRPAPLPDDTPTHNASGKPHTNTQRFRV